jgi:MYXO-CTERM domain-containing protein
MSRTITLATCLAIFSLVATAEAHFKLNAPAANLQQDSDGSPQKTTPCGGAGTPTNMVTDVRSGAMLSISVTETVPHSGFYRVAVAPNMAGLPADPTVAATNCTGLMPSANPTLPVLGDGLLVHTGALSPATQTMQVMIPAGMTCNNCILQVIQYMYPHSQPCFYYHCATVNISPNAPPPPDGGINPGGDAGVGPSDPTGGCCSSGRDSAVTGLLGGVLVGLLAFRRRRRR